MATTTFEPGANRHPVHLLTSVKATSAECWYRTSWRSNSGFVGCLRAFAYCLWLAGMIADVVDLGGRLQRYCGLYVAQTAVDEDSRFSCLIFRMASDQSICPEVSQTEDLWLPQVSSDWTATPVFQHFVSIHWRMACAFTQRSYAIQMTSLKRNAASLVLAAVPLRKLSKSLEAILGDHSPNRMHSPLRTCSQVWTDSMEVWAFRWGDPPVESLKSCRWRCRATTHYAFWVATMQSASSSQRNWNHAWLIAFGCLAKMMFQKLPQNCQRIPDPSTMTSEFWLYLTLGRCLWIAGNANQQLTQYQKGLFLFGLSCCAPLLWCWQDFHMIPPPHKTN